MSALVRVIPRDRIRAVLMVRRGLGWHVGIGGMLTGEIEGTATPYLSDREAEDAAMALADRHDLMAVRA